MPTAGDTLNQEEVILFGVGPPPLTAAVTSKYHATRSYNSGKHPNKNNLNGYSGCGLSITVGVVSV